MSTEKGGSSEKSKRGKRTGEYFNIDPIFAPGGMHGLEFENPELFITPPRVMFGPDDGQTYGFPPMPAVPSLRPNKRYYRRPPRDFEVFELYWLVSSRLKEVLENIDPESVLFSECDVFHMSGKLVEPRHYLCDIIRVVDALVPEQSNLIPKNDCGNEYYLFPIDPEIYFEKEKLNGGHIFRQEKLGGIFCDLTLKNAFNEAGVANVDFFRDVSVRAVS